MNISLTFITTFILSVLSLLTATAADTTYSVASRGHTGVEYLVHQNSICPSDFSIVQTDTTICKGASLTISIGSNTGIQPTCLHTSLPAVIRNGLIAYYPFCGDPLDKSGNNNNGVANNVTYGTDRFGNPGNAGIFRKNMSSHISVPASGQFQPTSYTISAWLNTSVIQYGYLGSEREQCIAGYVPNNWIKGPAYKLWLEVTDNSILNSRQWTPGTSWQDVFSGANTISRNIWHHVVTSYDAATKKQTLYLDGRLIGSRTSNLEYHDQKAFFIGASRENAVGYVSGFFEGMLDDIGLWNRALSVAEINMLHLNQLTASWSTGENGQSIVVKPERSGTYYVTISDGLNTCIDSIRVTVTQPDTTLSVFDPVTFCSSSGSVRMQAGVNKNYEWQKDNISIPGASLRSFTATETGQHRVIITDPFGCKDTSRSVVITSDPTPIVDFLVNDSAQCLSTNLFIFSNRSSVSNGAITSKWDYGDGQVSFNPNGSKTYSSTGTFEVKLVITTDKQCVDSSSRSVIVLASPPVPVISGEDSFCAGSSVMLSSTGGLPLSWYRNNVLMSGSTGSSLMTGQDGAYRTMVTDASGCRASSADKIISIDPLPSGVLYPPARAVICANGFTEISASGAWGYQWLLNGAPISDTGATIKATQAGNYRVVFISEKGCQLPGTVSVTLSLITAPKPRFDHDKSCVGQPTTFTGSSDVSGSGTVAYLWEFGDGNSMNGGSGTVYAYTTAGSYKVRLTIIPTACPLLSATSEKNIQMMPPTAGMTYPVIDGILNKPLTVSARKIGTIYQWTPSTGLSDPASSSPVLFVSRQQTYRVSIRNEAGCVTTDTVHIRVHSEKNIHVPKGFTPNNDGHNEKLYPILVGIKILKAFRIYNRWGLLMYDNKDAGINNGWDGKYRGKPQPTETYAWIAEGIDDDGNPIRRSGNTILIR